MTKNRSDPRINRRAGGNHARPRDKRRQDLNVTVAQMIYQARKRAQLTQQQLAALVGTKQPVIARLEDRTYTGHSLTMLQRIAHALKLTLTVHMRPANSRSPRRGAKVSRPTRR